MDKIQLNKYIKSITDQIPVVNSFYTDDVYEVWNGEEIRYGSLCFCITSSSISDNTTTWNGLLYYGDRLLDDKSNRDSVQSDANNVINAIMNVIAQDEDIVAINYPTAVTFFEQKFADYLAGGYADIQIETDNSISKCGYGFVKEQEGCAGKIAELEDEIEVLEEKNDRLSNLLDNANETLELAERNLMSCRKANEVLTESNQQLETENDRLESEVERLEESLSILPDYTSIGYNLENVGPFYQYEYEAIERAKSGNFLEPSRSYVSARDTTVMYFPSDWDDNIDGSFQYNKYVKVIPDCPAMRKRSFTSETSGLFGSCSNLVYVGRIKSDNTTINLEQTFNGCMQLKKTPIFDFPTGAKISKITSLLSQCTSLTDISTLSDLDISESTSMRSTFNECRSLTNLTPITNWNTGSVTDMRYTFNNCRSLVDLTPLANWDVSSVTSMGSAEMYSGGGMFYNCRSLVDLTPLANWDVSSVTSMGRMFSYCKSLVTLDGLQNWNTGSVTCFKRMFEYSSSLADLTPLANWDVSNVTDMEALFYECEAITDLSPLANWDTSKVTSMTQLLYDVFRIQKIPLLDCSSVTSIGSFLGFEAAPNLTDVGGFTGLKVNFDGLLRCPNLTVQSLLNVFNTIADVNGLGTRTLTIGSTNLSKLTDDQKAIATAKGWTLK